MSVQPYSLPSDAFLNRYQEQGSYTDCFSVLAQRGINLRELMAAFYTTPLFRSERLILSVMGIKNSDQQLQDMIDGESDAFAAWAVEQRDKDQILLKDLHGRTCSWLMCKPESPEQTRLYFGSAVVVSNMQRGWLIGLHRFYSVRLLTAAYKRLQR